MSSVGGTGLSKPGVLGNVLTSDGVGGWNAQGGVGWTQALNIDFTALGNVNLTGDGTKTFAGMNWKKENSANDRVPMAITSGVGLVIQPAGSTGYDGSADRSLPLLYLPLSQITLPGLAPTSRFRIWTQFGAETSLPGNLDYTLVAIDNDDVTYDPAWARRGLNGGNPDRVFYARAIGGQITSGINAGTQVAKPAQTWMVEVHQGIVTYDETTNCYYKSGASPWPDPGSLQGVAAQHGTQNNMTASPANLATGLGLVIGAAQTGGSDAYLVTITNLRLDYIA